MTNHPRSPRPIGIREAVRIARRNASGLVAAMDLEQLFGGDATVEGNEEIFTEAQERVVKMISIEAGR